MQSEPSRAVSVGVAEPVTEVRQPSVAAPAVRARWITPAIWTLAFALCVLTVHRAGTPLLDILRYAAYFGIGVTLPGVLLLRATTRSSRSYAEEAGLGTAVGLAWELAGWAIWTALGLPWMQIGWALVVPAVFLAVPRLRGFWKASSAPVLPVWWSAALALVVTAAVALWYGVSVDVTSTPPDGRSYEPDLLWHLALAEEAGRQVPPQIPQVAGLNLQYHWFADAHLASAEHITGLDLRLIVFRLWFAPLLVAIALCMAALARQVSRSSWTGPIAAFVTVVVTRVALWDYFSFGPIPVRFLSPSQTYGSLLGVAVAAVLLTVLYGRQPRRAWAVVGLLVCASAGAKPTTILLLLGGTAAAALVTWIRSRRPPRTALAVCAGLVVVLGLAMGTVTGSTAGTAVRLFGFLRALPGYTSATGDVSYPGPDAGLVLPGLRHLGGTGLEWTLTSVLAVLVSLATCVVAVLAVAMRRTRTDPAQWWLLGALAAGWLGFLLIDHPGGAQFYFLGSAVPFGVVLTVSSAAAGLRGRPARIRRPVVIGSLVAGILLVAGIRVFGNVPQRPAPTDAAAISRATAEPLIWAGVVVAIAVVAWMVLRSVRPAAAGLGISIVALVTLGMTLGGRAPAEWDHAVAMDLTPGRGTRSEFTAAENEAADWVRRNVPADDVVATNTACLLPRRPGQCDARGYLVSGIGGRRVYLEGWAYTQESMAQQREDTPFTRLPSPWPERARLTEQAITAPSGAVLDELRNAGVRWLFVDSRFGRPDTAGLRRYADERFDNGTTQVYAL